MGVTVQVKGNRAATTSGADGSFTINAPSARSTLTFSFVDYQPQEIAVNNKTTINTSLVIASKLLEDLVVIGYGTQKRANVSFAVSKLNPNYALENLKGYSKTLE